MNTFEHDRYSYGWYLSEFDRMKREAESFVLSINDRQFGKRPDPDTWSVGECYGHLNRFGEIYWKKIQKVLDNDPVKSGGEKTRFEPGFIWKAIIRFVEPPYRIKIKTVSPFNPEPTPQLDRQQVLLDYMQVQDSFIAQLEISRQKNIDLEKNRTNNPILTFLPMPLNACYGLVMAHQERHMWQARQILEHLRKA
ncbi:MAG: DinB family protein [Balneolaceae bacterium]|nr:DinB family protein [Balneolaceae bacterium]